MAGEWIPMRVDLAADPAVIGIASRLRLSEDLIVGKLHRLWSWAALHLADGAAPHVGQEWIDRYLGKRGFSAAMIEHGWLQELGTGVSFPKFTRWNSACAKRRLEKTHRQQRWRGGRVDAPVDADVDATPSTDASTRGEESRESNNTHPPTPSPEGGCSPGSVTGGNGHAPRYTAEFEAFWAAYPKRVAKGAAFRAWKRQTAHQNLDAILAATEAQKTTRQWQTENGRYIPHPATWLNGRRWEDPPPDTQKAPRRRKEAHVAPGHPCRDRTPGDHWTAEDGTAHWLSETGRWCTRRDGDTSWRLEEQITLREAQRA